ncbi:MAG: IS200/IS605 family transposase [Chitinispirillaceae bacterium]
MASTYSNLLYHFVFSTKNRIPIITGIEKNVHRYLSSNIAQMGGRVFSVNGTADHIHIVAKLLPRHRVSDVLKMIKGNSSNLVNESGKCDIHFEWQVGYGAFSVSKSKLNDMIRYIVNQKEHHRRKTFKEELIELLDAHEIEYDERYLWD